MIPQGWLPIGEPDIPELSPDAKKVRDYITENRIAQITYKTESAMCRALHMGIDRLQDAVYEFRKWEAIMAKNRLSDEQKAQIIEMYEKGVKQLAIASEIGCSQNTVSNVLQAYRLKQSIDADMSAKKPVATVNKEFDDAVNVMIEEAKKPAQAVQMQPAVLEPVIAATPETIPDCIWLALDDQCSAINLEIETRQERMAELRSEIEKLEKIKADIHAWLDAHEVEGRV